MGGQRRCHRSEGRENGFEGVGGGVVVVISFCEMGTYQSAIRVCQSLSIKVNIFLNGSSLNYGFPCTLSSSRSSKTETPG